MVVRSHSRPLRDPPAGRAPDYSRCTSQSPNSSITNSGCAAWLRATAASITVADVWQGRGVGTALLDRLSARARATGIERITARMIVGNDAARRLIARAADITSEQRGAGTVQVTARLREPR